MIRSIRTLDRPTPRFHGWATLTLAIAALGVGFLAYVSLVAIVAAAGVVL